MPVIDTINSGFNSAISYVKTQYASTIDGFTMGNTGTSTDTFNEFDWNDVIIPTENPLLKFDNCTWKMKLFTINEQDLASAIDHTKAQKYVLAETGVVSRYSIDEVVVNCLPPGSNMSKNSTFTDITVKLSETGNMKLYDDLQIMSQRLGYGKFAELPMYLEIKFVGYNNGKDHMPKEVPGCTKVWLLRFCSSSCSVENGGSTTVYNIRFMPFVTMAMADDWRIGEQMEITGSYTLKTFVQEFQTRLNSARDQIYNGWTKKFPQLLRPDNYYTFTVDPTLADLQIINDAAQDSSKDKSSTGPGTKTFKFSADLTIANVIDDFMDSVMAKNDTVTTMKRQKVHVIGKAIYIGFDDNTNTYVYRHEITILPYTSADVQDADDVKNSNGMEDVKEKLDATNVRHKYNIKRYDFAWSGQNNEVLKLDLNFDNTWAMAATKNASSLVDLLNRGGEKKSQQVFRDPIKYTAQQSIYTVSPNIVNADKTKLSTENAKMSPANASIPTISVTTSNGSSSIISTLTKSITTSAITFEGEVEQALGIKNASAIKKTNENSDLYFDDLVKLSGKEDMTLNQPIAYRPLEGGKSSSVKDSNATPTEIIKRLNRTNYYTSTSMVQINLKVVGDPYWLGKSDDDYSFTIKDASIKNVNYIRTNSLEIPTVNMLTGDSLLLLNLSPMKSYDYNTGISISDPAGLMSQSIYRVTRITSKFDRDGFRQDITAILITRSLNR